LLCLIFFGFCPLIIPRYWSPLQLSNLLLGIDVTKGGSKVEFFGLNVVYINVDNIDPLPTNV
jgi:uncharacterized membrane protein